MAAVKIKDGYVLRQIAGQMVALPADETLDLDMMITLNDTGAFLWECLQRQTDADQLVDALLSAYDVDAARARSSVEAFLHTLDAHGLLQ